MKNILLGLGVAFAFLVSCDSKKKPSADEISGVLDSVKIEEPSISEDVISDIIQQIPSPLEISTLLKESDTKYDKSYLNDPEKISDYNSNYKKALALGVYGTDLGYTNIYEQNQDALFYLNSIKSLADDLSIGQFFDIGTIKRLATNSKNLDSLLLITTKNFNNINNYLQEQKRSNLSILLLSGGWLEALYIVARVSEKNPDSEQLKETIAEQKIIMDNVVLLMSFYKDNDPNIRQLSNKFVKLQEEFNKIEIKTVYREPTYEVVDGMLVVQDNSTSEIIMKDENIEAIRKQVYEIRENIIN
ncbi:hypothetical protein SAMN05661096_02049 [Marivirga sericea]|uniref:Lipoprotein n=1 Tax=Marivirga sericea TaxID=1028 RepID=A0A1X7JX90_9BACT|nr:hypothetical protein [Marivirga sericea]SMG32878.1 hypothetical protein SAMN05661096_02049 [Marivirga sericea]